MKAIHGSKTQVKENVNALDNVSGVTVTLFGGIAALVGIWALACLSAALIGNGPIGLIKAYFSAVTGM